MPEAALRLLSGVGYARHLLETTEEGQAERTFIPGGRFTLWPHSCFVLTSKGERFARELLDTPVRTLLLTCPRRLNRLLTRLPATPVWDGVRRELRARHHFVVKHFDRAAPAQEKVLAAWGRREKDTQFQQGSDPQSAASAEEIRRVSSLGAGGFWAAEYSLLTRFCRHGPCWRVEPQPSMRAEGGRGRRPQCGPASAVLAATRIPNAEMEEPPSRGLATGRLAGRGARMATQCPITVEFDPGV
jgi:hypothetical protein